MSRRALVIGSQIADWPERRLQGVENDVSAMTAMLQRRGFDVDVRTGPQATREGILSGYDQLIASSGTGDAAVVYYSGHGFYASPANERSLGLQCLAPSDLFSGTDNDWRGITSWELSIKLQQLTARTRNVTVVLDCCHSAQMSRDAAVRDAVPRALPDPETRGLEAHVAALRAQYTGAFAAVDPIGNQDAVRLVACGQSESAFEYLSQDGKHRGAFTEALLDVLAEVGDADLSWAALGNAIRARVQRNFVLQRPEIEGPARRRLFSLAEDDERGIVTVQVVGDRFELPVGRLTGVEVGDVYGVMPLGSTAYRSAVSIATLEVIAVAPLRSKAVWKSGATELPQGAVAIPISKQATKRSVALISPAQSRDEIARAMAEVRTLRIVEPGTPGTVATLRLADSQLTIEDARGPLFPPARFPGELAGTIKNLANLGVAQAIRELEGEHGVLQAELAIELGTVENGQLRALPDHGAALGLGDRLYVKVANTSQHRLYIHVFNVGVRGKVTLLTNDAPSGVALDGDGPPFVLGKTPSGVLGGLGLSWPEGLARDGVPRLDEVVVIATSSRTSLLALETQDFIARSRGRGTQLQALVAQLQDGLTRELVNDQPVDGFSVKRLSWLLHPRSAAMSGLGFEVDEGQAASRAPEAWVAHSIESVTPKPDADPIPAAIAIKFEDLVVWNHKALSSANFRVDALICTRSERTTGVQATWTQSFAGINDGQRLPLERPVLYLGPVHDFVDLTLFVSRDTPGSPGLAQLFAQRATGSEFKDAAGALLITAGAVAAPWVAAIGGGAVLARMAYELVLGVAGKSIGLYRTSFLSRERFGVGRHPVAGVYRAPDFSFSIVVEPVELAET